VIPSHSLKSSVVSDPVCAPCRVFCVQRSRAPGPSIMSRDLLATSAPTAVAEQGRCQPVRHPRFPSNPRTQSGPRAEKISGRCLPLPGPQVVQIKSQSWGARHGHIQVWLEPATSCNLGWVLTFFHGTLTGHCRGRERDFFPNERGRHRGGTRI
jgi:hypothetical protein